jgi:hypothetical protein
MNNPKVFISHASEDKERFVLEFAKKLRDDGIDAWLDIWEMLPGDSLIDKIFNEGLKNAKAVIVVLSKFSINKKWVKEELNAAIIKKINSGSKLIPVLIDDCEIPEPLKSTVWQTINNINNYDIEYNRIIYSILGHSSKPELGKLPKYTEIVADLLPGLSQIDNFIFTESCKIFLSTGKRKIPVDIIKNIINEYNIPIEEFTESIALLHGQHLIKATFNLNKDVLFFEITVHGSDEYLRIYFQKYDDIYKKVCISIFNGKYQGNQNLAEELGQPIGVINHILDHLNGRGFIKAQRSMEGQYTIYGTSFEFKRMLKNLH